MGFEARGDSGAPRSLHEPGYRRVQSTARCSEIQNLGLCYSGGTMARLKPVCVRLGRGLLATLLVLPLSFRIVHVAPTHLARRVAAFSQSSIVRYQASTARIRSERLHIHTIVPGDTLWAIAQKNGITVVALAAANRLPPCAILRPGETLRVPPRQSRAAALRVGPCLATTRRIWNMRWPTRGIITSPFGWRWLFQSQEFHPGIDIGAAMGTPVRAAQTGVVRTSGWVGGWGRRIILDHGGGLETLYAHLSRAGVWPGERVQQGMVIGMVGSTGRSTGPHLHFGVLRHAQAVNPIRYLQ